MTVPYRPIDCGLHDELQLRVMRGRVVEATWTAPDGTPRSRTGRLLDVFSRDGAEYLRLADGTDVRLDRLVSVDGVAFGGGGC